MAASYEARKYGVHSAMPSVQAKRLCPHAVFLAPRMQIYAEISHQIQQIFRRFTSLVEPLSLDEAFLDVTGSEALFGSAVEIGQQIKTEILNRTELVASVGVAPNKFLAKVASDLDKPDGFVVVDPKRIQEFLDPLSVARLWGVGRVAKTVFDGLGVRTVRDVRRLSLEVLEQHFGEKNGRHLWSLSHGLDERRVVPDREARSVSHETTFAEDIDDMEILRAWAIELTEQVAQRMRRYNLRGRTVQLKVRFSDFRTITRSTTLPRPTNVTQSIWAAAEEMLSTRLPAKHMAVRLLGVGVSGFDRVEQKQLSLFDAEEQGSHTRLDSATDKIREKLGSTSIRRASGLLHHVRHVPKPKPNDSRPAR